MARSMIWQIDMGDGTWSACCKGCRLPLGRGPRAAVARLAGAHVCEPPVPPRPPPTPTPAGLTRARWAAPSRTRPWTDAPPTPTPRSPDAHPTTILRLRGDR